VMAKIHRAQPDLNFCNIAISHSKMLTLVHSFLVLRRIAFLTHGFSAHLDAVGVVNQAVEMLCSPGFAQ
jgi:hypothetical protein